MLNVSDDADKLGSEEEIDLFEFPELQPKELNGVCLKFFRLLDDSADYRICAAFLKEVEALDFTFDYYLDAAPYGLRKNILL
jgi:hypothetical protein